MSLLTKVRTSNAPPWRTVRSVVKGTLTMHVPATGPMRMVFRALFGLHIVIREGVLWGLRFVWYEPLFRSLCERVGTRFRMERLPYLTGNGRIVIGSYVRLSGKSSINFGNRAHAMPEFVVGDHTFIGHNCSFAIAESISIGSHCLLAGGARLADFDGHSLDYDERRRNVPVSAADIKPIVIGSDVWIGAGVCVLKGVRIGDRSIIGAGSVVSKDIPADVVAAGNPARVVRRLTGA